MALKIRGLQTQASFVFGGHEWVALPQRVLWWPAEQALVLTDLHLGKAMHFKKNGLHLPTDSLSDLAIIAGLVSHLGAQWVLCLGDLFHSKHNAEWVDFAAWRKTLPVQRFVLVKGNHDILASSLYAEAQLETYEGLWEHAGLAFTHYPKLEAKAQATHQYWISGHVHPAVTLRLNRTLAQKVPGFWVAQEQMVLPAFGHLTGTEAVTLTKGEHFFGISGEKVIHIEG